MSLFPLHEIVLHALKSPGCLCNKVHVIKHNIEPKTNTMCHNRTLGDFKCRMDVGTS